MVNRTTGIIVRLAPGPLAIKIDIEYKIMVRILSGQLAASALFIYSEGYFSQK